MHQHRALDLGAAPTFGTGYRGGGGGIRPDAIGKSGIEASAVGIGARAMGGDSQWGAVMIFDRYGPYTAPGVPFQACSLLERGGLTGKITVDTRVNLALARGKIKWFQSEFLPKIAALGEKWAPQFRKYNCSMTHLVIGWTAARGNTGTGKARCGARKLHQSEENAMGGDLVLDAVDVELMRKDPAAIA